MKDLIDKKNMKVYSSSEDTRKNVWEVQSRWDKIFNRSKSVWISNIQNEKEKPFWDFRGRKRSIR